MKEFKRVLIANRGRNCNSHYARGSGIGHEGDRNLL
jgi:hypothetical protein